MHRAIRQLSPIPQHLIIDGNRFHPYYSDFESLGIPSAEAPDDLRLHDESTLIPHQTVVKGDGKYLSIAAASIIAKTTRDDIMTRLADQYPAYNWQGNKGYPTADHYAAIAQSGITSLHRKTFRLYK